ncbi:MAG: hypothetical protein JXR48_14070 [Candidatus Delongbacteria bacterium]|nr:hypothetical protein [Candidatus Delongbacteria bacterium]
MIDSLYNYIGTEDYWTGVTVEFTGVIIEITILSILIPFILWLYRIKANRREKYNAVTIIYAMLNNLSDQLVLLFDYDEITDDTPTGSQHTNITSFNPVLKYYIQHLEELEPLGYENSYYYSNLKIKLYCLENSCNNNEPFTNDKKKLDSIKQKLIQLEDEFSDYKIFQIKKVNLVKMINYLLSTIKITRYTINELTADNIEYSKAVKDLHQLIFGMISIFYEYKKFYDHYTYIDSIRKNIFEPKDSGDRDTLIAMYKDIEERNTRKNPESFLDLLYVIKASGKNKWLQYFKLLFYIPYYLIILKPYESITKIIRTIAKMRNK